MFEKICQGYLGNMGNKTGYCPMCNKALSFPAGGYATRCPDCGHHVNLHTPCEDGNEDLSDGALE